MLIGGADLLKLLAMLVDAVEQLRLLRHRGFDLREFVGLVRPESGEVSGGDLPVYRIVVEGKEEFYHDEEPFTKRCGELAALEGEGENGNGAVRVIEEELHEVQRLNELRR